MVKYSLREYITVCEGRKSKSENSVTSTVPGFDQRDSHMAADNASFIDALHRVFPEQVALINRLVAFGSSPC